ncbi:MAG: hypothetical protein KA151_04620 [Piscinibacter sp.]|nr:hypothetical protein [Piscinibacter sp.]
MRASCLLLIGWLALAAAPAVSAAPADEAMLDDGDGLKPTLPRLQGRVRLGMSASTLDLSGPAGPAADGRLSGASVLGDYYFSNRYATRDGDVSGFRATTGVYVGSRTGLWGGPTSLAPSAGVLSVERHSFSLAAPPWADDAGNDRGSSGTVPYIGLGYSSSSLKGGFSYSADLGLMALSPGSALRLGRAFGGGQSLEDLLRDLRFSPVVQVGVSYSF